MGFIALGLPYSVHADTAKATPAPRVVATPATTEPETKVATALDVVPAEPVAVELVDTAPRPQGPPAESPPPPGPCAEALAWVAEAGLRLPAGVDYHCPSTQFSHHGAACWNGSPCRGRAFIAINMDLLAGTGPDYLRHVVAHEVCHILDFQSTGTTTEAAADACAADHGAPA